MADLFTILPGDAAPTAGPTELGNKAWNLGRLAAAGLSVPAAFVLPTSWCSRDVAAELGLLRRTLAKGIARLEAATGLGFGSARRPLLVSVRSGAATSMPGMLETVLNLGISPASLDGLLRLTGNPRLAWDSYRRLVQSYGEVVAGLPASGFEALLTSAVATEQVESERDLDHRALRSLTHAMLEHYAEANGSPFPVEPMDQLVQAVIAVFRSWDAHKAVTYRRLNGIPDTPGTAVTIQTMVFGNAGGQSGSGVGFTRDPASGVPELYFDFCFNGQGEDVVAGRRTMTDSGRLARLLPHVYAELQTARDRLETAFRDVQDFEFTVQDGRLWLLQTRAAKRTPWAALRIAVDMVDEGLIDPQQALRRLDGLALDTIVRTRFSEAQGQPLARAAVASPGVACGAIALDAATAQRLTHAGKPAILVRPETATSDIAGMADAVGILTAAGSRTAHAAVVARQLGKVCLIGCTDLTIDGGRRLCRFGDNVLAEGDMISLDGNSGAVYAGALPILQERPQRELAAIANWRRDATRSSELFQKPIDVV